jgi:hypothetical protein
MFNLKLTSFLEQLLNCILNIQREKYVQAVLYFKTIIWFKNKVWRMDNR